MLRSFRLPTTLLLCLIWLSALSQQSAVAAEFVFSQDVGGSVGFHSIGADDSLVELARRYDVGYNEITAANPDADPFVPEVGSKVTIPGMWILPEVPRREGIVINVAEMRLYYFPPHSDDLVETFPIGIGDEGWDTPTGSYRIIEKIEHPAWHVPVSIRTQQPELPPVVAPGPGNPLGDYALRLSIGTVLIHGTNRPFGIGRRVSHGCIHLYPEDICQLFRKIKLGTGVTIVWQPVKATLKDGRVLLEVHRYKSDEGGKDDEDDNLLQVALELLKRRGLAARVDLVKLKLALLVSSGLPTDVTAQ